MNMRNLISIAILSAAAAGSDVAAESTVLVTEVASAKDQRSIALDYQSRGDVSAFNFALDVPGEIKSINTSKCLSELPKGVQGMCQSKGNRVAVVVWTNGNTPLAAGMTALGTISYTGTPTGQPMVSKMEASSPDGASGEMTSNVDTPENTSTHER